MAVLAAAQLLDELMGRNRNIAPDEKGKEINWEDADYCKYFMVKFCPHDLFVNTRADLGACPKLHDEEAKKLFEKAKNIRKIHYQEEFLRFCNSMINEVERKIVKGKQRLALSTKNDIYSVTPTQTQKAKEQIDILNERINNLEVEAESAGTDGNVEQAQGLMKLCDQLKEERDTLRKQLENGHWSTTAELAAAQEKQMEVCEVCGAFLIVGDAQQRIDDHLQGKQHMGYAKLKIAITEISEEVKAAKEEREKASLRARSEDRKSRDRERSKGRECRDRDRDRDREKERDRRRDKERDRSEHRPDKERRDRDKDRRDPDRHERKEKDRDRDREREKDRDRERDRERRHRDRDKGRDSKGRHHSHRH